MCGIVGLWEPGGLGDTAVLDRMARHVEHRGPDADGTYVEESVGLGHRRLSIIDPDAGAQPLFNEDGDVAVVFNGEIYNYRALRADLEAAGHRLATDTDTEVLVHLYEERGPAFVADLEGMFAFVLYDASADRLVLARDRFGIKPLYLAREGDRFAFASELPALFEAPLSLGGLDERAIGAYFGLGFIPSPLSAFERVDKLRPAERVVIEDGGITRDCFYSPTIATREPGLSAAASELRARLRSAVEARLMSDVPLGAFLSGGIDSSIVVALLAEVATEPVRTFTVGFEASRFDESWAGRTVAEHVGADHTTFQCAPAEVRELIPDVVGRLGEPMADPSLVPTSVVARETGTEVTVALSGDGGDELFAGYDKYRAEFLSGYYRTIPRQIRRRIVAPVIRRLPADRHTRRGEAARKLRKFLGGDDADPVARQFGWLRIADGTALELVRTDDPSGAGRAGIERARDTVEGILPAARQDSVTTMQAVDVRHSLPDQLLAKVDRASMAHSLEVRVPFLAADVLEYAFSLPRSYKLTARRRKRVLKQAFRDDLPAEILERGKQGFDMPIGAWLKGPLAADLDQAISDLAGTGAAEVIDVEALRSIVDEHRTGRADHGKFLWATFVFATWWQRMRDRGVL